MGKRKREANKHSDRPQHFREWLRGERKLHELSVIGAGWRGGVFFADVLVNGRLSWYRYDPVRDEALTMASVVFGNIP